VGMNKPFEPSKAPLLSSSTIDLIILTEPFILKLPLARV
jgi:hypothetical protein